MKSALTVVSITIGSVVGLVALSAFLWALTTGLIFATAKTEKPLNDIHREAVVCSLEYVQATQNTLVTQVSQYQGLELQRTQGQDTGPAELALLAQMRQETGTLSTCDGTTIPASVQAFMTQHGENA